MKLVVLLFILSELFVGLGVWGVIHATEGHPDVILVSGPLSVSVLLWSISDIVIGFMLCGIAAWRLMRQV